MAATTSQITPVPREPGDHAATAVHTYLRGLILDGTLAPGAELNQVTLAPLLGVSRTPVREAIRMLQEEGLVDAQPQKRARVSGFDPSHLDAVYAERVLLEGLAAQLTASRISDAEIAAMEPLLDRLSAYVEARDVEAWNEVHTEFHRGLITGANPHLQQAIIGLQDRTSHYRFVSVNRGRPRLWRAAGPEHEDILQAYARHHPQAAAAELTKHLARTALWLIGQLAPTYDPVAIRTALRAYNP